MPELSLEDLVHQIAEERGLDLRAYKTSTLERRIRHRMFQVKKGDFHSYMEFVRKTPREVNDLLNTILINVTEFFRDPQAWEALRKKILPRITSDLKPGDPLRVWSAGCATGEEAYSAAILLAEHFGEKFNEYDVKIYATDIDDQALTVARHGEYPLKALRRVPRALQRKYFSITNTARVNRELRRKVIFGKSNLASDAPISHVNLLICRNLLIYFQGQSQERIMRRLHYALEPEGVLFLGKSESQLRNTALFHPIDQKWRFFARVGETTPLRADRQFPDNNRPSETSDDFNLLKLQFDTVVEAIDPGILVLDTRDILLSENDAAKKLWKVRDKKLLGMRLADTEFSKQCPELIARLDASRTDHEETRFECTSPDERNVAITVKPIMGAGQGRAGTLIYMEDVTPRQQLQHTVEALETTAEELQSANEELETTNEELQSTNEELETTNEELQSLNEELESTNEEIDQRGKELDRLNARYSATLENLPWPVMLVGNDQQVLMWNSTARKLFGFNPQEKLPGFTLDRLPLTLKAVNALTRRFRSVMIRKRPVVVKSMRLAGAKFPDVANVHFKPILNETGPEAVMIMFRIFSKDDPDEDR